LKEVKPLIISASRRTDIPAFFMEWFLKEWKKGWTEWVNPFNSNQRKLVSFENVKVVVFWSKYPVGILRNIERLDFNYILLYTVNYYPDLEASLPPLDKRIEVFQKISKIIGKRKIIWRFDPVVFLRDTKVEDIVGKFDKIAKKLEGFTTRVITSILTPYPKVVKRMRKKGFEIREPEVHEIEELGRSMKDIARSRGMDIQTCADRYWKVFEEVGVKRGACIDPAYIYESFGKDESLRDIMHLKKDRGQRDLCMCSESIDIGRYNTCKFGCLYCYAI
jgi:DNA repair photolyase